MVTTRSRAAKGGRSKLWGYGYADLAQLFGMTVNATRKASVRGRLDPGSLESVIAFLEQRRAKGR